MNEKGEHYFSKRLIRNKRFIYISGGLVILLILLLMTLYILHMIF